MVSNLEKRPKNGDANIKTLEAETLAMEVVKALVNAFRPSSNLGGKPSVPHRLLREKHD
jgi:hypothetical protein